MKLHEFHDATLNRLEFDWAEGSLAVQLKCKNITTHLLANGVSSLNCTRKFPWGRSVSVNGITLEEAGRLTNLTIEMQSGDQITASITSYELRRNSN